MLRNQVIIVKLVLLSTLTSAHARNIKGGDSFQPLPGNMNEESSTQAGVTNEKTKNGDDGFTDVAHDVLLETTSESGLATNHDSADREFDIGRADTLLESRIIIMYDAFDGDKCATGLVKILELNICIKVD